MHGASIAGMVIGIIVASAVVGLIFLIWRPPASVIRYFQRRWPEVIWEQVDAQERMVALTIDDGPSEFSKEILDILRANETTATFFVIGSHVAGRERVLHDLLEHGSELGNHALYDEPSWLLTDDELASQIRTVDLQISNAYNTCGLPLPPKYFRPGSGFFTSRMSEVVESLGYRLALGGVYPHDPQIRSARLNAWHIMSLIRSGAIIICHDGRPWTAPMLRDILPKIRKRGYRVVCLSELLGKG